MLIASAVLVWLTRGHVGAAKRLHAIDAWRISVPPSYEKALPLKSCTCCRTQRTLSSSPLRFATTCSRPCIRWDATKQPCSMRSDTLRTTGRGFSTICLRWRTGAPAVPGQDSPYGEKFEVSGILKGPSGGKALFVTVWLVPAGGKIPRFITAYPG
jgi:hypothetical protein